MVGNQFPSLSQAGELTADFAVTPRAKRMRLTIFSRVMIAQGTLILLVLGISIFAVAKLRLVSQLNTQALTVDSACINEEKRLLKSFLDEMRNSEKYLLMRDLSFRDEYESNKNDFSDSMLKISYTVDTEREKELISQIEALHERYEQETDLINFGEKGSEATKANLSEGIIERANELIRLRDQAASSKTALAGAHAASAAEVMFWLTAFGIAGALVMAYLYARGISRPLSQLAREMRRIGRGEFYHTAHVNGP